MNWLTLLGARFGHELRCPAQEEFEVMAKAQLRLSLNDDLVGGSFVPRGGLNGILPTTSAVQAKATSEAWQQLATSQQSQQFINPS